MGTAKLILEGQEHELPTVVGSEGEVGIDISTLRGATGAITLDPGYGNTGSCQSDITFIDGEKGILRYRGYPIEQLAENAEFTEICYLLIYGDLPTADQLDAFRAKLNQHSLLHENIRRFFFEGYPPTAHPMAMLTSVMASLSTFYPADQGSDVDLSIARLLAKQTTIAAAIHKKLQGEPLVFPRNDLSYCSNFLNMLFSRPTEDYKINPAVERALNLLLVLHGDHEQNCSTSTVRMVGSSRANLFASVAAGICALWGPLHGGANQRVIEMLQMIHDDPNDDYTKYVEKAKSKDDPFRLMGFGHRVYKNFDPRARILKKAADEVLESLGVDDPRLEIAKNLERVALEDDYFVSRKLYPNVDFYSGLIYSAMGLPPSMFTVMFAIGRMPGWIAQWKEMREDSSTRINRPRQVYTGPAARDFVPLDKR